MGSSLLFLVVLWHWRSLVFVFPQRFPRKGVGFPFLVQFKNRINDSYFNNFLFQEGLCGAKA